MWHLKNVGFDSFCHLRSDFGAGRAAGQWIQELAATDLVASAFRRSELLKYKISTPPPCFLN